MDDFKDLLGRLARLKKSSSALYDAAEKFYALRATGEDEIALLKRLAADLVADLQRPANGPPPPQPSQIR